MYLIPTIVALGVVLVLVGVGLYFAFAPGPRRWRAYNRARKLLDAGQWEQSLAAAEALGPARLTGAWQARLRNLMGESHQLALDNALKEKDFERALGHAEEASRLLELGPDEGRGRVVDAALAELRKTFAETTGDPGPVQAAVHRVTQLAGQRPAEATFWLALTQARVNDFDAAVSTLSGIYEQAGKLVIDVTLYLGILSYRLGKPQDALRYLAEANRIDPNCPLVPWQMGVSLIASNGDSGLAVRALQRALGTRGLPTWQNTPDRLWVEAFPEGRSYVRRLATRHRYVCPLLGSDLKILIRQGQLALAQGLYRLERWQDAADLYGKLLETSPPTILLLRGYGLSLARLGLHDQAYKHLRGALEQETNKDPLTAGYLALCGALGKPTNPDDKPKNIAWALRLLGMYPLPSSAEWAYLASDVHAEARKFNVAIGLQDQMLLCDSLASIHASDPRAASAYAYLASTHPDAVKPPFAWLYARAATAANVTSASDLDLFARTFQDLSAARSYFEQQNWDLAEVEYTYLERSARQAPGRFPAALGQDYPVRGEQFLLSRSEEQEKAGQKAPARASVEVLLQLAPTSVAAHDRLACLHYRSGELERAVELLGGWHRLAPGDHWPLVRQAIIEQERGNAQHRAEVIDRALGMTQGRLKSSVALLGARLAIRHAAKGWGSAKDTPARAADGPARESLESARHLLQLCLHHDPEQAEALWCLAAIQSQLGDREALAAQAPRMDRAAERDGRFHFFGAVCHLAAGDYARTIALCERVKDAALATETKFVMAWAQFRQGDLEAAQESLRAAAGDEGSPSAVYAKALLGQVSLQRGKADEAVKWWSAVDAAARSRWGIDEPLRNTVLLAGLHALQQGRYEPAAERFREAAKFGLRDRRLGGLITLALVKAGQQLLYEK